MTKLYSHLKKGFISILSLTLILSNISVYAIDDTSNIIIEDNNLDDETTLQHRNKNEENTFIQDNKNITPSLTEQVITPDEGNDYMAQVTVSSIPVIYKKSKHQISDGYTVIIGNKEV